MYVLYPRDFKSQADLLYSRHEMAVGVHRRGFILYSDLETAMGGSPGDVSEEPVT